ncbi:Ubiquinone/menaquinone biosynthesis methyltransferase UBIE [Paenibacillus pasadenensis]|uniref:Ubiquinone/menaquinone biosynthesis methyltransferase UBIE n=1 Tax=Paenibacillus pasadenensis TaxID=217090 RepID=A0A2N5N0R6_9BACL|nr:class I SAM-dependent methyltransferase [Paenibacillus pasadenensis]PLT43931.1 Ubiquinone/menaquinone biosynthesis methyltransferase UBIE [Paenibacillus pasadenensis]
MKENKYDDPEFFDRYSRMPRSQGGLDAAGEWPALRAMLPPLDGKRVLDLGCGYGWHARYAREQGAASVLAIDLSEKMLERARELTDDPAIDFRRGAIEDIAFLPGEFDVVLSSLAFHYVGDFAAAAVKVHDALADGGSFVFSVEHPIFTALPAQDWQYGTNGEKLHWPVDRYHDQGLRSARFLGSDVIKYHRTVSTYLNALLAAGFSIRQLSELAPTAEMLERNPAWAEEARRPMFFLIAADKTGRR